MALSNFPYTQSFEIEEALAIELKAGTLRDHLVEEVREELVSEMRFDGFIRTAWGVEEDEDCERYIPIITVNGEYLDVIFFDKAQYPGQEVGEIAQSILDGYRPQMADTELQERKKRLAGWLGLGWIEKGAA